MRQPKKKPISKADLLDNAAIKAREELSSPDWWKAPRVEKPHRETKREAVDAREFDT